MKQASISDSKSNLDSHLSTSAPLAASISLKNGLAAPALATRPPRLFRMGFVHGDERALIIACPTLQVVDPNSVFAQLNVHSTGE